MFFKEYSLITQITNSLLEFYCYQFKKYQQQKFKNNQFK